MRAPGKWLVLWVAGLSACGGGASYSLHILFPNQQTRSVTEEIEIWTLLASETANCRKLVSGEAQPADFEQLAHVRVSFPVAGRLELKDVAPGRVWFFVAAWGQGVVLLRGCTEALLEQGESIEIAVQLTCVCNPQAEDCGPRVEVQGDALDNDCDGLVDEECDEDDDCNDHNDCTADHCLTGACQTQTLPDRTACDDGLFCTDPDYCLSGQCTGDARDCEDGVPCTVDSCDSTHDRCTHTPNAGGCPDIHIGPAPNTCPHLVGIDLINECDFTGTNGLINAVAAVPVGGASLLLYDNLGAPASYDACALDIPGLSYLGAAGNVDPANVRVGCPAGTTQINGVLHLAGDGVHLERLTIFVLAGKVTAVSAWPSLAGPSGASGGHLIENITAMAMMPELCGGNSIMPPLMIGPQTTIRNSHFWGYFENDWDLTQASDSRFVNNTFVYYQACGNGIDISGVRNLVFANNVMLSLTRTYTGPVFLGNAATTGLLLVGNAVEGIEELTAGLDPNDQSNIIRDNLIGPVPLESPARPFFLADASVTSGTQVPGEGLSLDGVAIGGQTSILPGAFQKRSALSGPRRQTVRVGPSQTGCGAYSCDVVMGEKNEMQKAVWSVWPGGRLEVYPAPEPYAGNAVLSWGMTVVGMGQQPEEVVLKSAEEDADLVRWETWTRHGAVLTVLRQSELPAQFENLTVLVVAGAQTGQEAFFIESPAEDWATSNKWHSLRRVRVGSQGTGAGLTWALYLGDRTLVQDVLVHGDFQTCIRYGPRAEFTPATPPTTGRLVNFTCRLSGSDVNAPQSVLDVASVTGSIFANLVVETSTPVPFLRAQRRTSGDNGGQALDAPVSFVLDSVTTTPFSRLRDGFSAACVDCVDRNIDVLNAGDPLFVDRQDSHLHPQCTSALDNGVAPSELDAGLSPGISLDGVERANRIIDRGAYEQGL